MPQHHEIIPLSTLGWRVPGLGQIIWRIVLTKKWGATRVKNLDQKAGKSRISHKWAVEGVEAHGHLKLGPNVPRPGTKYKRSKIVFAVTSIAFTIVHICTELLQLLAQSLIGIPSTLLGCDQQNLEKISVRLQVGWAQVSTRICWWLVNSVTQTQNDLDGGAHRDIALLL